MPEKPGGRRLATRVGLPVITMAARMGAQVDPGIQVLLMPGMDDAATFEGIREIPPEVRVLLSSGYALEGQAADILDRGCDGFIQKPFDLFELSGKLRSLPDL